MTIEEIQQRVNKDIGYRIPKDVTDDVVVHVKAIIEDNGCKITSTNPFTALLEAQQQQHQDSLDGHAELIRTLESIASAIKDRSS